MGWPRHGGHGLVAQGAVNKKNETAWKKNVVCPVCRRSFFSSFLIPSFHHCLAPDSSLPTLKMATTTTTTTRSRRAASEVKSAPIKLVEGPQYPDIQTIRDAIPAHCFVPSTWRSLGYVVRDVSMAAALGWAAFTYIPQIEDFAWRTAAWIVYGYVQGLVCTGIWILAHEAGHGAFSVHQKLNDVVGWTLHSALLVPYFSWKFSHHRHHRFTGHMEKDMAFVPHTKADREKRRLADLYLDRELFEDIPVVQLFKLVTHQLAGWQMYLLFNVSAGPDSQQSKASWWRVSHFEPTSAVFRSSEALYVAITDLGLLIVAGLLYLASTVVGWKMVFLMYAVPYFWVHHWLGKFCLPRCLTASPLSPR
jgi:omega-6 fatty acid desaturase (delta-12 desaturase)